VQFDSLKQAIDKGAEMCGGQNALARYLHMPASNLSAARNGRKAIPKPQLLKLADLIGTDAADLWLLAQEYRNPFRESAAGALAAWLVAVLAVILSGYPEPAKASIGAASQPIGVSEHAIHCRGPKRRRRQRDSDPGPHIPSSWCPA